MRVCVIGAGVIGLSSALCIAETVPEVEISVISDKFTPYTTGDGSGGLWFPHEVRKTPTALVKKWGISTYDFLVDLAKSPDAAETGIHFVSGYQLFSSDEHARTDCTPFGDMLLRYENMSAKELALFPEVEVTSGVMFTTIMCECSTYLPWIMNRLKKSGTKFIQGQVTSLEELSRSYDVIVNCAGIGAKALTGDDGLEPVRGQLVQVEAPWVKHFWFLNDCELYAFPRKDCLVLGGTHVKTWDTEPTEHEKKNILDGCCKLMPSLRRAKIIRQWAGLRPVRERIRIEAERIGSAHVVHNYGHGGAGVTLHWGCAQDVAQLVKDIGQHNKKRSQAKL